MGMGMGMGIRMLQSIGSRHSIVSLAAQISQNNTVQDVIVVTTDMQVGVRVIDSPFQSWSQHCKPPFLQPCNHVR